ncbi:MAG: FAD-dependent oxidoreductase, partial [Clostridia bacterium]|nr:FAD-dependent oxidoreductase [Clostridia bacterium]
MYFQKEIPSLGHYELVVLGGGPAGVCAAIEAARNGAKVLLIEGSGMLGGMATTALVGPFMTNYDREGNRPTVGGLYREILERLAARSGAILPENTDSPSIHTSFIKRYHRHVTPFDSFMLQVVLDEMVTEAGVEVLLYTRFVDCICENGKIKSVILAALEGLCYVNADLFVDATGNADVAYAAGVPTWKGEEESGVPQPGTLMFEVDGVSDEGYLAHARRPGGPTGAVKAYRTPTDGVYKINHLRVFDTDATNSASMTRAHMEARRQVLDSYGVLRETPGFENARITQVAPVLGVRESRHIEGKYKITVEDVA